LFREAANTIRCTASESLSEHSPLATTKPGLRVVARAISRFSSFFYVAAIGGKSPRNQLYSDRNQDAGTCQHDRIRMSPKLRERAMNGL